MGKRWKEAEDWWNKQVGCERIGHISRGTDKADGQDDMFSYDITSTKQRLAFLTKEMKDAEKHATGSRMPVVVIFQYGKSRNEGFVITRAKDWIELHGR